MRLLHTTEIRLIEVYGEQVPPYAVLSHTWGDEEATLQEIQSLSQKYREWTDENVASISKLCKIRNSAAVARREGFDYIWIDTCCIDKTSSAELSEAINSMYRWYNKAGICYAYLCDADPVGSEDIFQRDSSFRESRWFTRGWTLQELIAARDVHFYARDWSHLGSKLQSDDFTDLLSSITGVHREVLSGALLPSDISIASRMRWAAFRKTTRVEDIAYCLLGIFEVNIPLLYGEGENAFLRLQEAILLKDDDQSLFAWHSTEQDDGDVDGDDEPNASSASSVRRMWGLLAQSPDQFCDAGDIKYAMPLNFLGTPAAVTSRGLRLDLLLRECTNTAGADYTVMLSCEKVVDGSRVSPVIYLRRLWGQGDQFARVLAGKQTFEPPTISKGIGIDDEGFYMTVFVRQNPTSGLPLIRISSAKEPFSSMPTQAKAVRWVIKDVHPKGIWNERSQCLETRDFRLGKAIGVFRVELQGITGSPIMDLAVGMNMVSQRSCRSWCHLISNLGDSKLEDVFARANQGRKGLPGIVYEQVSSAQTPRKLGLPGIPAHVTAAVSEGYGQRSLAVSLHIFSRDLERTESTEDYGIAHESLASPTSPQEKRIEEMNLISTAKFIVLGDIPDPSKSAVTTMDRKAIGVQARIEALLADIAVTDSVEISIFQRWKAGDKVRSIPTFRRKQVGCPVKYLSEYCRSASPNIEDDYSKLVDACFYGRTDEIAKVVRNGLLNDDHEPDSFLQFWPLHWAILGHRVDTYTIGMMLRHVSPLKHSARRLTPVHLAALMGHSVALTTLLTKVGQVGGGFHDPLDSSARTAQLLECPMHFAAAYATCTSPDFWNSIRKTETSRDFMVDDYFINALGETPLHRAAAMGNLPAAKFIIEKVLADLLPYYDIFSRRTIRDVNSVDNLGRTPLWHAACSDSGNMVSLLIQAGAFVNLASDEGLAPVHVACREGCAVSLGALLEGGADPNLLTGGGIPLLPSQIASIFGHDNCLEVLLEFGAEILSEEDGMCFNALHMAIANLHNKCARGIWSRLRPEYNGWTDCIVFEDGKPVLRRKWVTANAKILRAFESEQVELEHEPEAEPELESEPEPEPEQEAEPNPNPNPKLKLGRGPKVKSSTSERLLTRFFGRGSSAKA